MKILFIILGGWISRMVGGGWPDLKIPAQWLYAIPYGLLMYPHCIGIVAYVAAAVGKRTAHAAYIDLGHDSVPIGGTPPLDFIVRFFFGVDRGGAYWRCCFGMAVTGLAVTLVPGILYAATVNPLAGLILAFSGALKAVAYMIGWKSFDIVKPEKMWLKLLLQPTVNGEILTGIFGWGAIAWVS